MELPFLGLFVLLHLSTSSHACNAIAKINHGSYVASKGNSPDSVVTFSCDEGYALYGARIAICKGDGHWTTHTPKCYRTCAKPSDNIRIIGRFVGRHGYTLKVECRPGYSLPKDGKFECKDGTWKMGDIKGIKCVKREDSRNEQNTTPRSPGNLHLNGSISIQEGSPPSHGSPSKHTQNKAANDPSKEDRGDTRNEVKRNLNSHGNSNLKGNAVWTFLMITAAAIHFSYGN